MSDQPIWKESYFLQMRDNPTERVNAEYLSAINMYHYAPAAPCAKKQSLKLLKQFYRKDFSTFWSDSIQEYLPAVSEGTMKLAEKKRTHDEAVQYAKELIVQLNPNNLAKAFLYGVAHNAPEYRTALACYYYIKNLPEHSFERSYVGSTSDEDIYCDHVCEICKYNSKPSDEPKMGFWHININMAHFYFVASVPFKFDLGTAIVYLEEYARLPVPESTPADLTFFNQIIAIVDALPENAPPSILRKELKRSGLLNMTIQQIDAFIDMLGYLNILHTDDSFGVTVGHTKACDMLYPLNARTYFAHPVNRWTRRCGIDHAMIHQLFHDLY